MQLRQVEKFIPILKNFIKAERLLLFEDFIKYNGKNGAKEARKVKIRRKEYIKNGDVIEF